MVESPSKAGLVRLDAGPPAGQCSRVWGPSGANLACRPSIHPIPLQPVRPSHRHTHTHHRPFTSHCPLQTCCIAAPYRYMEIPLPAQHTTEMHPQIPNTLAPAAVFALFPLFDCLPLLLLPVREAHNCLHPNTPACSPAAEQAVAAAAVAAAAEGVWGRERGGMHAQVNRHSHSLLFEGGLQMKV